MANSEPIAMKLAALEALANGIIPADDSDGGAAAVEAGKRLVAKIDGGINADLYRRGIERAEALAQERFRFSLTSLQAGEMCALIGLLRAELPGFFKQLRMDVCAMYLSDP